MATVRASFGAITLIGNMPVFQGSGRTETVTSSGTASTGTLTAANGESILKVTASAAVNVAIGATATASVGTHIPANVPEYFVVGPGAAWSVIDL